MTVDVTVQSAYVAMTSPPGAQVTQQSAYVVILPGTRVAITQQSAYLAMFDTTPPVTRRRRVSAIVTG